MPHKLIEGKGNHCVQGTICVSPWSSVFTFAAVLIFLFITQLNGQILSPQLQGMLLSQFLNLNSCPLVYFLLQILVISSRRNQFPSCQLNIQCPMSILAGIHVFHMTMFPLFASYIFFLPCQWLSYLSISVLPGCNYKFSQLGTCWIFFLGLCDMLICFEMKFQLFHLYILHLVTTWYQRWGAEFLPCLL